jgi:exosortase/archaeosortase family protein
LVKNNIKHHFKAINAPLLWRVLAFSVLFVIISGLLGPRIINHGILYRYHFAVYGGLGKALLFGLIAFVLLVVRSKTTLKLGTWGKSNALFLLLGAACVVYAWVGVSHLIKGTEGLYWPVATHITLLGSIVFSAIGCFGITNIRHIVTAYRQELVLALGLAAGYYIFLELVYGLWEPLAGSVLHAVAALLRLSGLSVTVLPPRDLLLSKFGINVAQYCSGIESIALFTGLYAVIGIIDWQRFNHNCFLYFFPFGLLVLFGFNIIRVYSLILAGYYINPTIAFSLFHTYAGMVFFIIYSAIFWGICYRFMLLPKAGKQN